MPKSVTPSRQAFWLSHLQRAQAERISVRAYARREGLSEQSLYAARRKGTVAAPKATGFATVRVSGIGGCELSLPGGMTLRLPEVPSAAWLATFLRAMAS